MIKIWVAILNFLSALEFKIADKLGEAVATIIHFFIFWIFPIVLLYIPLKFFPVIGIVIALFYVYLLAGDIFLSVFDGVPQFEIPANILPSGLPELLSIHTEIFASKGELRRLIEGGGLFINKSKVLETDLQITRNDLINDKYLLVQKGRKNYYLIIIKR